MRKSFARERLRSSCCLVRNGFEAGLLFELRIISSEMCVTGFDAAAVLSLAFEVYQVPLYIFLNTPLRQALLPVVPSSVGIPCGSCLK